jgi:tetratricopeptide (TPR) repeat protein
MLTKQKKLSRKEIKQDKLVELYYKSQNFFEENKNKILMYAGAVAVVIIAIVLYTNYRSGQNEEAGTHLAKVMDLFDMGAYLEAVEGVQNKNIIGLKKIVQDYGSTENGEIAKIYLANSYAGLGKTDEALKYYEDYSGSIDIFQAAALAGRAGIKSAEGNYKEAAELYLKASRVSKTNVLNPDYMLQASINFIEAGEKDEAKNILQTIKTDYKTSAAFVQVDRYLSQLN